MNGSKSYVGTIEPVKSGAGESSYQTKSQVSFGYKQTGSYGRVTHVEKASAGEFQWKNGTSGTRSEYKQSETVRFGDPNGYTEVYNEQKVRNVKYNNRDGGYENEPELQPEPEPDPEPERESNQAKYEHEYESESEYEYYSESEYEYDSD